MLRLCPNTLTPARTPRLGLFHKTLTLANTPRTHQDDVMRCITMWEPTVSATIRSAHKSVHPLETVITTTHPVGPHLSAHSVHSRNSYNDHASNSTSSVSVQCPPSRNSYNDQASNSTSSVSVQCPPFRNRGDDQAPSWTASSAYSCMYRMTPELSLIHI